MENINIEQFAELYKKTNAYKQTLSLLLISFMIDTKPFIGENIQVVGKNTIKIKHKPVYTLKLIDKLLNGESNYKDLEYTYNKETGIVVFELVDYKHLF